MIVDSHAYCFQPGDETAGFATAAEHLAWIQPSQALHYQPAWRLRDRAPASSEGLGEVTPSDWSSMPDVDFRIDRDCGRVVWTIDGEEFTKQFYLPNLRNLEFTPHSLIAEMDTPASTSRRSTPIPCWATIVPFLLSASSMK